MQQQFSRRPFPALPGLLLFVLLLTAQLASSETLLFTGATVHTVISEPLSPGQVLVKDGRIVEVGAKLKSSDAKIIDLQGQHLYPGLIAAATSLGLAEISAVRATLDTTEVGAYTPDVHSWMAVNPDSELIPVARANGITHALPVPAGGIVSGQSGLIALDGWTVEDMAVKKPVALHIFWPSMQLNTTPKEEFKDKSKWKSLDDQARQRRVKLKELDDFFAEAAAYAQARAQGETRPALVPAWEAMLPFVRGEIPLMIHADDARQIKAAVEWTSTHKFKMILAGARDAWRHAGLLASNQVPVIYDSIYTLPPGDSQPYDVQFSAPGVLHRAGVEVAFSLGLGGFGTSGVRNLPYAAAQAIPFGLPPNEALRGLTLYPARLLGVADRLGSIEPGKEATFVLADGDILDLRTQIKRMWIAGREVSLESRHTRLYEKYKARPKANQP